MADPGEGAGALLAELAAVGRVRSSLIVPASIGARKLHPKSERRGHKG